MAKVILVTGASAGLGKVMASKLANAGHKVYGTSRSTSDSSPSLRYRMLTMDVRDAESVNDAINKIVEQEGRLDVLINNAGISASSPLETQAIDRAQNLFDTNVWGLLRVIQTVLPVMREQTSGLIINISSIAGLMGVPYRGIYSASKYSVEAITETLSMEVKPFGIKVCMIEPGDLKTDIFDKRDDAVLKSDSPYQAHYDVCMNEAGKGMESAPSPELIGDLALSIINQKHPRLRYKVGPLLQRFSVTLKTLLPNRVFESILMKFFHF